MESIDDILEQEAEDALEGAGRLRRSDEEAWGTIIIQGSSKLAEKMYGQLCSLAEAKGLTKGLDYIRYKVKIPCLYTEPWSLIKDMKELTICVDHEMNIRGIPNARFLNREGNYFIDVDKLISSHEG